MSTFPSVISTYSTKVNGQIIDASDVNNLQNDVIQIENVIGVEGNSSVVGTLEYFVKSPASDGGGHVQTANKGGTGQTSYNKGDILVASSSSILTKLSIGSDGQALVVDNSASPGIKWGAAGFNIQSFVSNGTWNKPSMVTAASRVLVQLWGGGGGGAGGGGRAGGGGGGAYIEGWFGASMLGITEQVYVGAGGASVLGGDVSGNAGNPTTFGSSSILFVYGGGGGVSAGPNNSGGGGGGWYSVGDNGSSSGTAYPGSYGGGTGSLVQLASPGGLNTAAAPNGPYAAGGGGAGGNGGNAIYGGAGGGGIVASSTMGLGGTSKCGGNGGKSSFLGHGVEGSVPGGGGGATANTSAYHGGKGGDGKAIIITYI
jgi:hypothetical protein